MSAIPTIDQAEAFEAEVAKLFDAWTHHRARCSACSKGVVTVGGDEFRCEPGKELHAKWWKREGDFARARVAAEGSS